MLQDVTKIIICYNTGIPSYKYKKSMTDREMSNWSMQYRD